MNVKRVVLFVLFELALLLVGIWLAPRALGLFFQLRGGKNIDRAIRNITSEGEVMYTCEAAPASDENAHILADSAIGYLQDSLEYYPQSPYTHLLLGRAYCILGEPRKAIQPYLTYILLRPNNPLGHMELGFAYEALSNKPSTEGVRPRPIHEWKMAGMTAKDFSRIGDQMVEEGNYEKALVWYKRAEQMGMNVDGSVGYTNYLNYERAGDQPRARDALQQIILEDKGWSSAPFKFLAWYRWGKLLFEEKNYPEAEAALLKAIALYPGKSDLKPSLSEAYRFLGSAKWGEGQLDQATEYLRQAVEINQDNTWGHILYGQVLYMYDAQKVEQTHQEFIKAINLQPDQPEIWLNLIDFWKWAGETEMATLYCQQAEMRWAGNSVVMEKCGQ